MAWLSHTCTCITLFSMLFFLGYQYVFFLHRLLIRPIVCLLPASITRSSSPGGIGRSNLGCCVRHQLGHLAVDLKALLEQLCISPTPSDFPPPLTIVHASSNTPLSLLLACPSTLLLRTPLHLTTAPLITVLPVLSHLLTLTITSASVSIYQSISQPQLLPVTMFY